MEILLVDDDEDLADVLRMVLQKQEYAVEYSSSAVAGSEKMHAKSWDLIILDWDMPDGSGIELCKGYRAAGGLTPILMMTGRADVDDKEAGLDAGADDYITKPFDFREIQARVKSLLRRSTQYSPAAALRDLAPGTMISERYKLSQQIGEGGMATVWLADDKKEDKPVVVKIVHGHLLGTDEVYKRFEQEWRLLAKIRHPNVVAFLDAGTLKSKSPFLVMEYVKGRSLRNVLVQEGQLPLRMVVQTMVQICNGLQAVHDEGIVHRDLKPDNILLRDQSEGNDAVKIVDFGLARIMELGERLTRDDMVVGTLEYLSPEQLKNTTVDACTDIYGLGILFFELLCGEPPFTGDRPEVIMAQHLGATPKAPTSMRFGLNKEVDRIIMKALEKDPADRYQTATAMRMDIQGLIKHP